MNIQDVFNNESLYSKKEFKIFTLDEDKYNYDEDAAKEMFKYIGIKNNKIVTLCNKCNKEFPFDIEKKLIGFFDDINHTTSYMSVTRNFSKALGGRIDIKDGHILGGMPPYPKTFLNEYGKWYIEYQLTCTNDSSHKYLMIISIEQRLGTFIVKKIGQDPSMLSVHGFDFEKYKEQLTKINAYDDYKKADLSNTEHFYVGAYAYLRRIFEKMLNNYIKDNNVTLKDDHVETQIKAVKDCFDSRIKDLLKNLYSILSKSIHELDEEQSKEYYQYLKAIIDIQLEFEYTENEKNKQSKQLNSILNKIVNEIK